MKGGSLPDQVARARLREANESRLNESEAPSPHLGGPPEPWENAIGDTRERVGRQGRAVMEYAERMEAIGVEERSLGGPNNPVAKHVAEMGRGKMRLLNAPPSSSQPKEALRGNIGMVIEEDESSTSSSDTSESSTDDSDSESDSDSDSEDTGSDEPLEVTPTQTISKTVEPDCEDHDDIGLLEDTELRNAVEDFDSSNWTLDQLEASCHTLLEECYASEDRRRRLLSAGMLVKLVETYPTAFRWMERNLEAVVNDGLPGMVKSTLNERVFRLDLLLGVLTPAMAESMTQLQVMERALRLMTFEMDAATRIIQFRYTSSKVLESCRDLPQAASAHKRMTLLKHGSALRSRWRNVKSDRGAGTLSPEVRHAHLCVLLALISKETCPKYFRMNRVRAVGGSGLMVLVTHLKTGNRSQRLSCRILREIAREPLLINEILKIGLAGQVAKILPALRETSMGRTLEPQCVMVALSAALCQRVGTAPGDGSQHELGDLALPHVPIFRVQALDALDSIAFSAMRFCVFNATVDAEADGENSLLKALVADGSDAGGLEAQINLPAGKEVEKTIGEQLGQHHIVRVLAGLLEETDAKLFMAGIVILGKMACTVCYHSVLQEFLAYAGRALERLIQGLQSQEELVPDISLALFLQLCMRQEGRDGIEASDGAKMLRPLISSHRATDSPVFLRALACAVALARRQDLDVTPRNTAAGGQLPRAGGVGSSGPARPHKLDLTDKLYNDLVQMLDAPPPSPSESVQGLVRMGSLHAVMEFLVRDGAQGDGDKRGAGDSIALGSPDVADAGLRPKRCHKGRPYCLERSPHYFQLPQRQACLGAVVLHGLVVLAGPQPVFSTDSTVRYLCYSIQVAYTDLTVGRLSPDVGYPLMFRSIQLACRALAFLATSEVPDVSVGDGEDEKSEDPGRRDGDAVELYHGALRRVADGLLSTSAINEVARMAQMPSKGAWVGDEGSMYRHLERTVSFAALLIGSICPVPAGERDPFTRFDQPRDESASLKHCQPLMEWLVKTVGRALCTTLMVTDSLDIISHTCRALSKLSATNTTVQMLLDSHDLLKAITRLAPRAPAILRPGTDEQDGGRGAASSTPQDMLDDDAEMPGSTATPHDFGAGRVLGSGGARRGQGKQDGLSERGSGNGVRENPTDLREDGDGYNEKSWTGYKVPDGEMKDVSTRKLCSLPFDFFRLIADIARVPSGRADIQRSGLLKRCLERFALEVSGCLESGLKTLRCRSEICVLIARMAGTFDRDTGAANDFILAPRYRIVRILLGMMAFPLEVTARMTSGDALLVVSTARHNAAFALAELCKDAFRSLPVVAKAGGIELVVRLAKDPVHPMPFIKHVTQILKVVVSFPEGVYASSLTEATLLGALNRISNSAYPGFLPSHRSETHFPQSMNPTQEWSATQLNTAGSHAVKAGRKDPPLPSAFGLPKPSSSEGRLIAELAQEVAFSIGAIRAQKRVRSGTCNEDACPQASAPTMPPASAPDDRAPNLETLSGQLDDPQKVPQLHPTNLHETQEAEQDAKEEKTAHFNSVLPREGTQYDLLPGKLGTYMECGVTTCGGLGAVGKHGEGEGHPNAPHPPFVVRAVHDAEGREHRHPSEVHEGLQDRGNVRARDGEEERITPERTGTTEIISTPLALLSARDAGFRRELIRRKEYYDLSGARARTDESQERISVNSALTSGNNSAAGKRYSPPGGASKHESLTHPKGRLRSAQDERSFISTVSVDAATSPLLASTRPPYAHLAPNGLSPTESKPEPSANHMIAPAAQREFVKFARPAAHWVPIDNSSDCPWRTQIERDARKVDHTNGHVIGRFACRGYLLDPTFADPNLVTQHPRQRLVNSPGNMENQLKQALDGNVPVKPVAPKLANGVASTTIVDRRGTEPYQNAVEVMRHQVNVFGARKAGKRRFFDERGRPLSAVTFQNLDECFQKRREEHTEPDVIPFP